MNALELKYPDYPKIEEEVDVVGEKENNSEREIGSNLFLNNFGG
jgi:hypothetical protein